MKNLILILALIATLGSCNDKNRQLDPNAMISVQGVYEVSKSQTETPAAGIAGTDITDSLDFIVKYAFSVHCKSGEYLPSRMVYEELQKDYVNKRLKFFGTDVVRDGELGVQVTTDIDFVVVAPFYNGLAVLPKDADLYREQFDTVAYIPNRVILEARKHIIAAFEDGDFESVYSLFETAYVFLPTTGAEWRELKSQGIE